QPAQLDQRIQPQLPAAPEIGCFDFSQQSRILPVKLYTGFGRARVVGSAVSGCSGQKCLGYRPRISTRTSFQDPFQKPGKSCVSWTGRPAGESNSSRSGTLPRAM